MPIDKQRPMSNGDAQVSPFEGPIEIELELPEGAETFDEMPMEGQQPADFNENLADLLEEDVLQSLSSELVSLYEEDKESRKDWYEAFSKGLDLLGIRPHFSRSSNPISGTSL